MTHKIITVPIVQGFDHNDIIGSITIRADKLLSTPNFVFSLGIKCLEQVDSLAGSVPKTPYMGKYELFCVSPVHDEEYLGYLKQVGVA